MRHADCWGNSGDWKVGVVGSVEKEMMKRTLTKNRSKGWTYLFYLLGGIAVIPIAIGILVIPKDKPVDKATQDRRIDWIGGLIVTAGLCLFCFSLTESGIATNGWATPCASAYLHLLPPLR